MELEDIVPWGRNLAEYQRMFALDDVALSGSILGCGDGPASFNAEATRKGIRVKSVDPIYAFDRKSIARRISEVSEKIMQEVRKHEDDYVWRSIESPDQLKEIRLAAMNDFLSDFDSGLAEGRYHAGSAPDLPFRDKEFDLALCSHFLFLYTKQFGFDAHLRSVRSLVRVASEVRIFPLSSMHSLETSDYLGPVMDALAKDGISTTLVSVDYEFMRGATEMLLIKS